MTFGEKLFALRKEKGLTAKEAAKQTGTSESTLLRMEKGKVQPKTSETVTSSSRPS
jgi:transcriptional regulator with XRE-family HTH domain